MTGQRDAHTPDRRREVIMAFLGAGLPQPPARAVAVEALASARRAFAAHQARGLPAADWLSSEMRRRGIRENAAALAVMEIPEHRHTAAHAYAQRHPGRADALNAILGYLT